MKRVIDFLIACILIALTLPLMATVAVAIKWESPGPVLYRWDRLTLGGRRVEILKFRTTLHQPQNATPMGRAAPLTRVGWFLRFTRIEDLPQFVNVLRGELTLIGDRDRPNFLP
jgi:putative colanic acid biosysnthesis UDP-glucose lipid carrier transferase